MRETKIRAWDTDFKEYVNTIGMSIALLGLKSRYIFEQYTGLKDKNGIDIYEGDIVKIQFAHWHTSNDVLIPEDYEAVATVEFDYKGVCFVEHDGYSHYAPSSISNDCIIEVIGNTHENEELMAQG